MTYKIKVISKLAAILATAMVGYWFLFFIMSFLIESNIPTPPNPFKVGACLANQYSIGCTGPVMKTDLEVPILIKDQERLPQ